AAAHPCRPLQLPGIRRVEQLSRVPAPQRGRRIQEQRPVRTSDSMNSSPRIVITGVGAVCGAGLTIDAIWNAVQNGRSSVAPISHLDASRWPVRNAAEVEADNRTLVSDRKLHKIISRTDLFGLYAADMA